MKRHRMALALVVAGLGHALATAIILALPAATVTDSAVVVPVELVIPPPPEPKAEPEPEAALRRNTVPAPDPKPASSRAAPSPETVPADIPFTSLSDMRDANEHVVPPPQDGAFQLDNSVSAETASRVRLTLRRAECRKLLERPDPSCPKGDLFYEKAQIVALRNAPPVRRVGVGPSGPGNLAEAFLEKNSGWSSTMLGGEDNSMFIDPMRKGAYNAQRIREGKAPIWDRDLQRDLEAQREN